MFARSALAFDNIDVYEEETITQHQCQLEEPPYGTEAVMVKSKRMLDAGIKWKPVCGMTGCRIMHAKCRFWVTLGVVQDASVHNRNSHVFLQR